MNHLEPLWILKQLSTAFDRAECAELQTLDLSPSEALMLVSIDDMKQEYCYATDLHNKLGLSRPAVSSTMKRLRQKGFVDYLEDEHDDRKKRILLLPKGKQALPGLRRALDRWISGLYAGISPEQLEQTCRILHTMRDNL